MKNTCRKDVEKLELKLHRAETCFQIWQQKSTVLKNKQRPVRMKCVPRFTDNLLAEVFGQKAVWQARNNVIGSRDPTLGQDLTDVRCGSMSNDKTGVLNSPVQVLHELTVQLNRNQNGIWTHAPQHFFRNRANTGAKFHQNTGALPIDLRHQIFYEEAGTWNN